MTRPPRYQEVAIDLRRRVLSGEFGVQLPPESRLLADYQVGEATLRPALLVLELEGLLTRQRGSTHHIRPAAEGRIVDVSGPVEVSARMATDEECDQFGLHFGAWVLVVADLGQLDETGQPSVIGVYPAAGTRLRIGEAERPDPA